MPDGFVFLGKGNWDPDNLGVSSCLLLLADVQRPCWQRGAHLSTICHVSASAGPESPGHSSPRPFSASLPPPPPEAAGIKSSLRPKKLYKRLVCSHVEQKIEQSVGGGAGAPPALLCAARPPCVALGEGRPLCASSPAGRALTQTAGCKCVVSPQTHMRKPSRAYLTRKPC